MQDFATVLQKYEERLSKANHVDGKQLAMNYFFPLIRKLAAAVGETLAAHEEALDELADALENDGDVLVQARNTIVMLSQLLDETMVAADFYKVTANGLEDTGKAPAELRAKFVEAAGQVVSVMQAIEEDLNGEDEEDEIESNGVGGAKEGAAGASAAPAAVTGAAASPAAREPDAVIEGNNAAGGATAAADGANDAA